MARLKFLLFSLLVLGAWAAHLYLLSPALSARAVEQAEQHAAAAPASVAAKLHERRLEIQQAALKVASNGAALSVLLPSRSSKAEAPTPALLNEFRAAAKASVPEALRGQIVWAIGSGSGAIAARGDGPVAPKDALDFAKVAAAGADGVTLDAFGSTHLFFSVPVTVFERDEAKVVATIAVGAPLFDQALLDRIVSESKIAGLALVREGQVVHAAGSQKGMVEKAGGAVKAGVLGRGEIASLGPLKLPFLTGGGDALGGGAPLWVASRQALASTSFDIVTVASVAPFMTALADYQRLAVFLFGGLFGLTLVFMLVLGGGRKAEAVPASPVSAAAAATSPALEPQAASEAPASSAPEQDNLDDIPSGTQFATEVPPEEASADAAADAFPFGNEPPPVPDAPAPSAPAQGQGFSFDNESTMAYPSGSDPFELASRPETPLGSAQGTGFNPEATRVASVPEELLRASALPGHAPDPSPSARMTSALPPPPVAAPVTMPVAAGDEAHYQEVFREFLRTREQCGEPPDGLTFERFAQKLRKNKEQLIAKYQCRTVRFTVYVKEGRAALKATPIKD